MKLVRLPINFNLEDKYTNAWTPGYTAIRKEAAYKGCRFTRSVGTDDYFLIGTNLKTLLDLAVFLKLSVQSYNNMYNRKDTFIPDFSTINYFDGELKHYDDYKW